MSPVTSFPLMNRRLHAFQAGNADMMVTFHVITFCIGHSFHEICHDAQNGLATFDLPGLDSRAAFFYKTIFLKRSFFRDRNQQGLRTQLTLTPLADLFLVLCGEHQGAFWMVEYI